MDWLVEHQLHALLLWLVVVGFFAVGIGLLRWQLTIPLQPMTTRRRCGGLQVAVGGGGLGLAIALSGLFFGEHLPLTLIAVLRCLLEGLLILPLMYFSVVVNDRLILPRISIREELHRDDNLGVGLVVAGSAIASGLMLHGALQGVSETWWQALVDLVFYWLLGQALLVAGIFFFDAARSYRFESVLEEEQNESIGILVCSLLISLGLVARAAIVYTGRFSWLVESGISLALMSFGVALLIAARWGIAKLLRRAPSDLEEIELNNYIGEAVVLGLTQIAVTILLATAIQRPW